MVMRVLGCFVLALMSTGPLLAAQRPGGEDSPVRSRVERQVKEMRRQMVEGRVFRSHVRVTVRLQNGNRIRGIVKDGVLVERVEGPRFVAAERDEEGAGVRLYYYNGKRSFVFLPFRDIKDYRINRRITALELAQIERDSRHRESEDARKREAAAAIGVVEDARNRLARPAPPAEPSRGR